MDSSLPIAGLAVVAFVATNFDNLLLTVAMLARPGQSLARVVVGVLLACLVVVLLCTAAAGAADAVPQGWLGWLGLVPLGLGLRELWRLRRAGAAEAQSPSGAPPLGALGVAASMLANSADSFGALLPLFAETRDELLLVAGAAILATGLLGCAVAHWITTHERLGAPLRRLGPLLLPFVLIAVGVYVLLDTPSDTVLP